MLHMIRDVYYWPTDRHRVVRLDHMLVYSVAELAGKKRGNSLQEPDYTAAIVTEFVPMAPHSRVFGKAKAGGTFIHQRPKVTFDMKGHSETCELGDLLVLCRRMVDGEERYNAALMQLKMAHSNNNLAISSSGELVQLYLYTKWPVFRCANGVNYDIQPKMVTLGAQYIFVNEDDYPLFTHHIPQERMLNRDYYSFGRFLSDFVDWQNGRPILDAANKDADEWSKLIWDVIEHNANAYFRRRNVGIEHGSRNVLSFLSAISNDRTDNPIVRLEVNGEEGIGCSMLFIDYAEKQE